MSPLDKDASLATGVHPNGVAKGVAGQVDASTAAPKHSELAFEPELEGSSYQTAPVTSLALARWSWAVIGAVIGAVLGFLAATGGGHQATATLQLSGATDPNTQQSLGQSVQAEATSDAVLALAVASLRGQGPLATQYASYGGKLPSPANSDDEAARAYLASGITSLWENNTNLVNITVTRPNGLLAIVEANAIAQAVRTDVQNKANEKIARVDADASSLISNRKAAAGPDDPEVSAIKQALGAKKADAAFNQKESVDVITASTAFAAGPDQVVSALLGAAGGAFLGALAAVAAGAGRRKPPSPREMMALAPELVVRSTVQAGELAGRALETGRRCVVVLAMPETRFAATQLGMAIAHHLRTHGATVALVDRVSEFSPAAAPSEDRLWALRRDVRRNIPANFSADLLVVVAGADEEALSLIAGQSDLLVAVVAKQRKTILADIRRTVDAVQISEPVVVLAR